VFVCTLPDEFEIFCGPEQGSTMTPHPGSVNNVLRDKLQTPVMGTVVKPLDVGSVHNVRDKLRAPLVLVGGFFRMCVLTGKALFRTPFQWRECILQSGFIMRVALFPTIMVSIPFTVLLVFTLNVLLAQFGAADISGAGAALGAVTQLGPLTTVLVIAGAGSTAICADLGARTIREEIDAMEVLGIDPIHRLVVPRVLAAVFVATLLNGLVITVGLVGGYLFGVYLQNVSGGAYLATLTTITGLPEVVIATIKAAVFGLIAGLVGCYRGLTVGGGAKGLGSAVNQTVVLCVVALFSVNLVLTTIGVRFGTGH
jgi:phospholipid/cholesterol/gamma-HCH transport system permease protein